MAAGIQSEGTWPTSMPWNVASRDANDRHRVLVDEYFAAHHIGRACKLRLPEIVGKDHHRTRAGRPVIVAFDQPSEGWAHAEDGEIAARDDFCGGWFRVPAGRKVHRGGGTAEYAVEEAVLQLQVAADRVRHQVPTAEPVGRLISLPVDQDQALGLTDRKGVQNHLIDQRVDGGGGADTERERKHGGDGKRRTTEKGPGGEAEVIEEIAQPPGEPNVADFLPYLGEAAEFQNGPPAGFLLREAGKNQVADPAVHVIRQFAIQSAFHLPAPEPVQNLPHDLLPSLQGTFVNAHGINHVRRLGESALPRD